YRFSASGLPPGFTLSSAGILRGPTTRQGTYTIAVQAVDANGASATASLSLNVKAPLPLAVPAATLAPGTVSIRYSQALNATGGGPPYSWTLSAGTLPAGLSLSPTGVLSGTPTASGTFTFPATATDSIGGSATGQISVTIAPPPLIITAPSPLPSGIV